ncbi:glycosyltransferase [Compostibacter hankyongensis]|uniref:Glycosyltransferase family 4 protein n=1 Tax=Compostibacter hankyongensis TaxID=1007089 RepID=A0ABP8FPM8_9BACT
MEKEITERSIRKKIIIIGSAHPLRGGLAAYNERLALEFQQMGHEVLIYTFSLQYPSFLFPGKSQYSEEPPPAELDIRVAVNSVNPLNWWFTGRRIRKEQPDIVVCKFWLPFMGPCFGTLLRIACRGRSTKAVSILDNVIPHEKRPGDRAFTRYFIRACHAFIAMSRSVLDDLRRFTPDKPARLIPHPLYDNFGTPVPKAAARRELDLPDTGKIILFFGFIRPYKGLDLLLEAMHDERIRQAGIRLLIAGEFYEDRDRYDRLIEQYGLADQLILRTDFIPDNAVKYYFCAADLVVQPYRSATQSGITPMAYHFEKPMVVTRVGGLPEMVPDEQVGLVTDPDPASLAGAILKYYTFGEAHFVPFIQKEKQKYSWARMARTILELSDVVQK